MGLAKSVRMYLDRQGVDYEVVLHTASASASRSAQSAHVSGEKVAKCVVLHDENGYVLVVLPATHRLEVDTLQDMLKRRLTLASENELGEIFDDCAVGAIPALGAAYGVDVVVERSLTGQDDIYMEGGDHRSLVHVSKTAFTRLMHDAQFGNFSHHV